MLHSYNPGHSGIDLSWKCAGVMILRSTSCLRPVCHTLGAGLSYRPQRTERITKDEAPVKLRFPRLPVRGSILFSGKNIGGAGTLINLSGKGCRVACEKTVPKGAQLTLRISLEHEEAPVHVDQAVVRWSKQQEFGVEFTRIRPEVQERLCRFREALEWQTHR